MKNPSTSSTKATKKQEETNKINASSLVDEEIKLNSSSTNFLFLDIRQ